MKNSLPRIAIGLALLLAVAAMLRAAVEEPQHDAPARKAQPAAPDAKRDPVEADTKRKLAEPALPELDLDLLARRPAAADEVVDAFAPRSWLPPPPPAQKAAPPQAPALPFTYMGKMIEDGRAAVFLARNDRSYVVRAGDTVENLYRVESIDGTQMTLTYLPLQAQQTLQTGTGQ